MAPENKEVAKPEETTKEDKPAENTPISLDDEQSTKEEGKEAKADVKADDTDFDTKFTAKFKEMFGDEPDNIRTKLATPPAEPEYKTEFAKLADKYLPSGMSQQDFVNFVATDFKKMEPIDVLDFKLSQENPALTAEERELILADEYKLFEDATPQEIAIGKHKMNMAAKAAVAEFETVKESLTKDKFEPADKTQQPDPKFVEAQAFWKKEAPNVIKAFDKLNISIKMPDPHDATKSEDVPIVFNIPEKDQQLFAEWVSNHGATAGVKTVEEMVGKLKDAFVAKNFDKLMQKQAEKVASVINEKWTKKMANYEPPKGKTPNPTQAQKEGSIGHFMAAMDAI